LSVLSEQDKDWYDGVLYTAQPVILLGVPLKYN